jgi:alpha-1,3-rhamnosyltransferase
MQDNPLVSVIIPAYNHELYIEEALQSVVDQTYPNIELIVINDGSTDGTAKVITDFISRHQNHNIQFINKQNEGVCKTLNKGLEMSTGEYVAFLASDDLWLSDRVSIQVRFLEKNENIGMVFSDAWFLRFNTKTDIRWSDYKPGINNYFKNSIQNTDMYRVLLTQMIIPALTVMIRKQVLNEVGFFDENLVYEDDDMWLRIALKYPIAYIDIPLALYRIHDSNISSNTRFMVKGMIQTIRKHLRMEPLKNQPLIRVVIINQLAFNLISNRIKKLFKIRKF